MKEIPELPSTPCQCAIANISVANHMENLRRNIFTNPTFEVQKLYDAINMAENTCGSGIFTAQIYKDRNVMISDTLQTLLDSFDDGRIDKKMFVRGAIDIGNTYIDNFKTCAMMEE